MACKIKINRHGNLAFKLRWNGIKSWEGTDLKDTPENRARLQPRADVISQEMREGHFDYLHHFPDGNKARLFRGETERPITAQTVKSCYNTWIKKQSDRVRPHRVKDYESQFSRHILPTRVKGGAFGSLFLANLTVEHLVGLQTKLKAKGLKAASVNSIVHGSLRAMLKDARRAGAITQNLFDRDLFSALPLTDIETSIDPYTPKERELILKDFRLTCRHYYPFVSHQFWTGARPSEACALREKSVDLIYQREKIERSRVQGHEAGTKTKRSNREIRLHDNLVEVLKAYKPQSGGPENHFFTTPEGTPIDESNFYKREWLPRLKRLNIRSRPFYNTRHSYRSFMLSVGAKLAFVAAQTGDSIKTLETHYAKYIPDADTGRELVEENILKSETKVKPLGKMGTGADSPTPLQKKKPLTNQGLKTGAGDRGRTDDLMLGKHTL
jgi:integrase